MDVGNSFRIYGDFFGWFVFDQLYSFLILSGLWLIPFLFFFYQAFFGNRGGGEGYAFKPFASLKTIEMLIYPSIIVFFLFMYPIVPASNATFVYNDGTNVQTSGATGTTYDQLAATIPDGTVKIPIAWYSIMWISSGVNHLVKQILPTGEDIRDLMYQQQQMAIDNPDIRKEFAAFEQHCRIPANIRFNVIARKFKNSNIYAEMLTLQNGITEKTRFKVAPSYPGNLYYMNYLYANNICSAADIGGEASVCIPKTGGVLTPQNADYGQTDCKAWWLNSLRGKLTSDLTDWNGFVSNPTGPGGTFQAAINSPNGELNDRLIFGKLGQSNANAVEKGLGDSNEGDWGWGWFKEKLTGLLVNIGAFFLQFPTTVIKFMLPIILGASIMILIIVMPIFILFTLYKPEKIINLVVLFFGISFIPAIWHIASWIDIVVLKVIWGDRSFVEGVFSLGHGIWNVFSLVIYIYFTKWWLQYLSTIGAAAAGGIGGMMESGASTGSKAMSEGLNKAKQAVGR